MSLIHDALKKAEQQRQIGRAPTLDSARFMHRPRRRWLLPLVLALIVAAIVYLLAPWPSANDAEPTRAVADTPAAAAASADDGAAMASADTAAAPPALVMTARHASPAAAGEATAKRPAPTAKPATPAPARPAPPPPAATPQAPVATPAAPPLAAKVPASIAPLAPPQPAPQVATAGTTAPAAAGSSGLPMIWQLPYAERKDLPAFKITMHVYSAEPADRFVILNGTRQAEGDDLGNGMTLVTIRRDGIVLGLDGKRFVVPGTGYP